MVAKPSWLLPKSLVDRKSTPLNSNLPSFPPRRSSDLAEHVVEYINLCPARVGGPIASGKHGCQAFVAASEKPGVGGCEKVNLARPVREPQLVREHIWESIEL